MGLSRIPPFCDHGLFIDGVENVGIASTCGVLLVAGVLHPAASFHTFKQILGCSSFAVRLRRALLKSLAMKGWKQFG